MAKFNNVTVKLVGESGNAFSILGRVQKAMKAAKIPNEDIQEYMNEAMSGDYDHLLKVTMETVKVV